MAHLSRRRALACIAGASLPLLAPRLCAAPSTERLSAAQLRADLAFVRKTLADTHPDLAFSADVAAVDSAFARLDAAARDGLTRDEAWLFFATLNPLFADAHVLIGYPDWRGDVRNHLEGGGTLFPYEVELIAGDLVISALAGGAATPLQGARIVAIDGEPAAASVAALLERMHGDTPLFRASLLARRWWLYFWKLRGAPANYRLVLARDGRTWTVNAPGSAAVPSPLRIEASFDEQYRLDFQSDGGAVLTVASFSPGDPARVLAFMRAAFATLRERGTRELTIDISANGGGDDAVWLEGLLPYLATQPYRTGSTYRKKVLETNAAKGEVAGQVVRGEIATWHQPQPDNPLRFKGRVRVAIGPATYSSAVLFANVMRDFGFATLVGTGGAARRAQSGGVRDFVLPESRLTISVPRFVLEPPGGGGGLLATSQ
jgi:Peptidase family S41